MICCWRVTMRYRDDPITLVKDFEALSDAWRFAAQQRRNGQPGDWTVKVRPAR